MPNQVTREKESKSSGQGASGQSRGRERESARYGAYGMYGSSDDQWDIDRPPASFKVAGQRYGILPEAVPMRPRAFAPGYEASEDAQPYRLERIYGWGPERYDEMLSRDLPAPKDDLQQQPGSAGEGGASLADQFAGADSNVPGEDTSGWKTGARIMHTPGVRTDEAVRHDICEKLGHARELDVGGISVRVVNSVVILEGQVPYRGMKHAMGKIAADCAGVSDVDNRISVRSESQVNDDSGPGLTSATDDSQVLNGRQI